MLHLPQALVAIAAALSSVAALPTSTSSLLTSVKTSPVPIVVRPLFQLQAS